MKRYVAVLWAFCCLNLNHNVAIAGPSVVNCAQFKARLKSVGLAFGIAVPAPVYEVSFLSATDPFEQWYIVNYKDHEATLGCQKNGAFESFQIWGPYNGKGTEEDFFRTVGSINLVSTAIYAYTGWSAAKTDEVRTRLMVGALDAIKNAKAKGEPSRGQSIELPGGYAHIEAGEGGFSLLIEADTSKK